MPCKMQSLETAEVLPLLALKAFFWRLDLAFSWRSVFNLFGRMLPHYLDRTQSELPWGPHHVLLPNSKSLLRTTRVPHERTYL